MSKQVKFRDVENGFIHGGILLEDGGVLCACCGGFIEPNDVGDIGDVNVRIEILETYDTWIDFSEFIIDE